MLTNGLIVDKSNGYGVIGHVCTVGDQNTSVAMVKNITWSGDHVSYNIERYTNKNFSTKDLISQIN